MTCGVSGGSPLIMELLSDKLKGLKREVSKVVLDRRAKDDDVVCHVLKTR